VVGRQISAFYMWGRHWRHLANTTAPSVCGPDAWEGVILRGKG